jgi:hypothetical protein
MSTWKVDHAKKTITSKSCPDCGESLTVEATSQQIWDFNHNANIQSVFPEMPKEDRERFITGTCGPCWTKMFGGLI